MEIEEAKDILVKTKDVYEKVIKCGLGTGEEFYAIETVLQELKHLQKENEELKNIDLTLVHLKGVADEKEIWRYKINNKIEFIKSLKEKIYYEENVISILESLID